MQSIGPMFVDFLILLLLFNIIIINIILFLNGTGMVIRTDFHKNSSDICQFAPFTLFPTPFPRKLFEQALEIQEVRFFYPKIHAALVFKFEDIVIDLFLLKKSG